jgi:hypothetical protein
MSLDETLFVGRLYSKEPSFSLNEVLRGHAAVREAVARLVHREIEAEPELWPFVATLSFVYSFNVYKALGLVLAERHHEAGASVLRQLWETSLNLHWIEQDADARAQDFCNFTTMEYRKILTRRAAGDLDPKNQLLAPSLEDFDQAAERFQSKFFKKSGTRMRPHRSFSTTNAQERARQCGDPWESEYGLIYDLTSNHAHGGPGAVLRPLFLSDFDRREAAEIDATALLALKSIDLIVRNVHVLARAGLVTEPTEVDAAARGVEPTKSRERTGGEQGPAEP